MIGFVYRLHEAGVPVSVQFLLELYSAMKLGLATDLDRFFLLSRLIFVKRVEHYDAFEQVFASYFLGAEPAQSGAQKLIGWEDLLSSKPFQEWLRDQIESGLLTPEMVRELDTEELLGRFWETLLAQRGEHHGGATWIGTRGTSHHGHSGQSAGGIRVYGPSLYGTARKVIENRQFISYSDESDLAANNLRQVLTSLKSLRPIGPKTELDVDETVARTAKNAGEIELIFRREMRNRLKLMVFLDNGGYSMFPYIPLVRTVFNKIRDLFSDVKFYYFHNCIYGAVYHDLPRTQPEKWGELLSENKSTRLVIIGDANMAPAELMASFGSLDISSTERKPGLEWLKELRAAFPVSVWLNPIHKDRWQKESATIRSLQHIFHMEDLTLAGIKNAVAYLNLQGRTFDRG